MEVEPELFTMITKNWQQLYRHRSATVCHKMYRISQLNQERFRALARNFCPSANQQILYEVLVFYWANMRIPDKYYAESENMIIWDTFLTRWNNTTPFYEMISSLDVIMKLNESRTKIPNLYYLLPSLWAHGTRGKIDADFLKKYPIENYIEIHHPSMLPACMHYRDSHHDKVCPYSQILRRFVIS